MKVKVNALLFGDTMTQPILVAKKLSKHFGGNKALCDLDLSLHEKDVFCLLGANGAGKTTTVNLFLNFIQPTSGEIFINGSSLAELNERIHRSITYIPEQVALYPELSGFENLDYLLSLSSSDTRAKKEELKSFLSEAGLQDEAHELPVSGYSKGMRQKVGIALALARKSKILILDEPTSGLDPSSADDFVNIIKKMNEMGACIFMVTHDIYRAMKLATRIGIMKSGKLVENLNVEQVNQEQVESLYLKHMRG